MAIYNFDSLKELTGDEILEKVSEEDIYNFYLGTTIKPSKLHKCCFHNDKSPSLGFYKSKKYLSFNCFGCKEQGNVFNFVSKLYNVNYFEALKIIINDFRLKENKISTQKNIPKVSNSLFEENKRAEIYPTFRSFSKIDYNVWNRYYLPLDLIYSYDVRACKTVYYRNKLGEYSLYCVNTNQNPVYCYIQDNHYKIYRPLSQDKNGKWLSNMDNWDIQGMKQLPESGDLLIITSSLKDVMVLKILGYYAIAPHGEGMHIPEKIMDYLFATWKRIIIFYDNDKAGIKEAMSLSKQYNIEYIYIPIKYKTKDISDFIELNNIDKSKKLMKKLTKS